MSKMVLSSGVAHVNGTAVMGWVAFKGGLKNDGKDGGGKSELLALGNIVGSFPCIWNPEFT